MKGAPSRYHIARQHNGRGWLLLRQDEIGSANAMVLAVDLPEDDARAQLAELRAAEVLEPEYPIDLVDEELRAAGGDPEAIGRRGLETVARAMAKRRERAS